MSNAYNRDRPASQSDVFDVHYYAHVSIKTEDSRQTRQLLAAEEKIRAIWRRRAADHRASAAPGNFGDTDPGFRCVPDCGNWLTPTALGRSHGKTDYHPLGRT